MNSNDMIKPVMAQYQLNGTKHKHTLPQDMYMAPWWINVSLEIIRIAPIELF